MAGLNFWLCWHVRVVPELPSDMVMLGVGFVSPVGQFARSYEQIHRQNQPNDRRTPRSDTV